MDESEVPTWMYRRHESGQIEGRVFPHPNAVPKRGGWVDSPDKVSAIIQPDVFVTGSETAGSETVEG